MNGLKLRLSQFIDYLNISISAFERQSGISTGMVAKKDVGLSKMSINKICNAFPILNRKWLETGEGEMLNSPTKFQQSNSGGNNQQIEKVGDNADLRIGTFYDPCPEDDKRIHDLEKEVESLKGMLVHKNDIISQMKKTEKSQENRINESNERISELKERIAELKERITELKSK